jgi:phosphoesterase RecJ-like protein
MAAPHPSLQEIGRILLDAPSIVIASHTRPDGDALGSTIALADTLRELGKTVVAVNQDGVPQRYAFLPCASSVRKPGAVKELTGAPLFVALDTSSPERLGEEVWKLVANRSATLVIDHHASNQKFGDVHHVNQESPATGQLIYELIEAMDWPLTPTARDNLWVAMATDTGSFQYPATTPRTFAIASRLLEAGVDLSWMSVALFQNYPFRRLELLRELLGTIRRSADGRIASWSMSRELIKRLGIQPDDHDGLIDMLRSIAGVVVAASFEEEADATVRISARSTDASRANVAQICQAFGGGGHRLAAGAKVQGTLESVSERFLAAVAQELDHDGTP